MAWSELPVDLLHCISSLLPIVDLLRFSIVCTSWNSALTNNAVLQMRCSSTPWLLLPSDEGVASDMLTFRDFTIEEGAGICHRSFSSIGNHIFGRRCIGSKDGWLVTLDEAYEQPRIFNPLTKNELFLPSLLTIPEDQSRPRPQYVSDDPDEDMEYVRDIIFDKMVLSSNNPFGTAIVIYGFKKLLAIARPGDHTWVLGPQLPPYRDMAYEEFNDVYFYEKEKRFYAITRLSAILSFDLNGKNEKLITPATQDHFNVSFQCRKYITFLSGTLLKIERVITFVEKDINKYTGKTIKISIFKFVMNVDASSCSSSQWISIKDLGDYSLFIGCNQTFSLHHMVAPGIRPNCIYFADHWEDMSPETADRDAGLFDLHNDHFEYFLDSDSQPNWPPSIWFTPSIS